MFGLGSISAAGLGYSYFSMLSARMSPKQVQQTENTNAQHTTINASDISNHTNIPYASNTNAQQTKNTAATPSTQIQFSEPQIPIMQEGVDPVEFAVRNRIQYVDNDSTAETAIEGEQQKTPHEIMEEQECQTCENRKYQDGSDDPGVSFKTPTNVAPEYAAAAVRSHEQEHVTREQSKAKREGREVVSQSVTIHTDVCPECGDIYVSGGTTHTTTKAIEEPEQQNDLASKYQQNDIYQPIFESVA